MAMENNDLNNQQTQAPIPQQNTSIQNPAPAPQATPAPNVQQNPQFAPAPQAVAPQAPIDTAKSAKIGWGLFALSLVITAVGLYFGYALVASAIVSAFAARLGLQAKNKVLATLSIIFCLLTLTLYTIAYFTN